MAANEDAIATACSYGIDKDNASQVSHSATGTLASTSSFSRKLKATRMMEQDLADDSDIQMANAPLSQIVEAFDQP